MKNKRAGKVFMTVGAILLLAALALFIFNKIDEIRAEKLANDLLSQLMEENRTHDDTLDIPSEDMTVKRIDGYDYIGYLTIPALNLELPVMAEWDYTRLKISPCRFSGSLSTSNLIICAHNYKKHFGQLYRLREGDKIIFSDMNGRIWEYTVVSVENISPTDIDKLTSDHALTLFTCTYAGKSRVIVRCDRITQ